MKISQDGIDLIKQFEGCKLHAYRDCVGILTIAYGHTGEDVEEGDEITQDQADSLLEDDLNKFEMGVTALVPEDTHQHEFDALVCFAYNVGLGNLKNSTLLKLHRAGDSVGASNQFIRWNRAAGKVIAGLTRRRLAEKNLYLTD